MTGASERPSSAAPIARLEADRIVAPDGTVLPLRIWLPETAPRAVVVALHGFNDHANAFADPAAVLARHGIATFAYDQRGFGRTALRGRWAGAEVMVDDALVAIALLRRRHPALPLYLMGESMGAAVAILAAKRAGGTGGTDGFILLAPAVWGRATMSFFERTGLWLADFLPMITWSPRLLPVSIRVSDNAAMLRALHADPLVIQTTRSDTLTGLVDLMGAALDAAPHFAGRALILYGERDEIVPRAPVARFVAALPAAAASRQRVALYPNGYHLLLRDLAGPQVTADLVAWLHDPNAPLPSGADRDARARLIGAAGATPGAAATQPEFKPS
ncbi:MAG TPA: lysophospholipase [Stellaceae bacterium]|nr:lysophospholipase [Stellaceae bacterium]